MTCLSSLSLSWLTIQTADPIRDEPTKLSGGTPPRLRQDYSSIEPRRAVHTFAWGARTMAQCVPCALDRIVSPHERNGIGYVRLKNAKSALPIRVQSVDVNSDDGGFTADLVVTHGDGIRVQSVDVNSDDGGFTADLVVVARRRA